jgi:hypothetical protein
MKKKIICIGIVSMFLLAGLAVFPVAGEQTVHTNDGPNTAPTITDSWFQVYKRENIAHAGAEAYDICGDPPDYDPLKIIIDWGDGTDLYTEEGTTDGFVSALETHRYSYEGEYTIKITVWDDHNRNGIYGDGEGDSRDKKDSVSSTINTAKSKESLNPDLDLNPNPNPPEESSNPQSDEENDINGGEEKDENILESGLLGRNHKRFHVIVYDQYTQRAEGAKVKLICGSTVSCGKTNQWGVCKFRGSFYSPNAKVKITAEKDGLSDSETHDQYATGWVIIILQLEEEEDISNSSPTSLPILERITTRFPVMGTIINGIINRINSEDQSIPSDQSSDEESVPDSNPADSNPEETDPETEPDTNPVDPIVIVSVSPTSATVEEGETVDFIIEASGGSGNHYYQFYGDDGGSKSGYMGNSATISYTYTCEGTYHPDVYVHDLDENRYDSEIGFATIAVHAASAEDDATPNPI